MSLNFKKHRRKETNTYDKYFYGSVLEKLLNTNMCLVSLKHAGMFAAHQVAHIAVLTALLTQPCLHWEECNGSTVTSAGLGLLLNLEFCCSNILSRRSSVCVGAANSAAQLRPSPSPMGGDEDAGGRGGGVKVKSAASPAHLPDDSRGIRTSEAAVLRLRYNTDTMRPSTLRGYRVIWGQADTLYTDRGISFTCVWFILLSQPSSPPSSSSSCKKTACFIFGMNSLGIHVFTYWPTFECCNLKCSHLLSLFLLKTSNHYTSNLGLESGARLGKHWPAFSW